MKPIHIVGTGSVASAFAWRFQQRGVAVRLVSRNPRIRRPDGPPCVGYGEVGGEGPRLLVAVPDDAVESTAGRLVDAGAGGGLVLHTAGCLDRQALEPLRRAGFAAGVCHPLACLPTAADFDPHLLEGASFAISGDAAAVAWARELAALWDGRVLDVDSGSQALYHAAAVTAGNHVVALLDSAETLMVASGVGREEARAAVGRLASGALDNVRRLGPAAALTGPLRRGDAGTLSRHLTALGQQPAGEFEWFLAAARRTLRVAERAGLDGERVKELESLLDGRTLEAQR